MLSEFRVKMLAEITQDFIEEATKIVAKKYGASQPDQVIAVASIIAQTYNAQLIAYNIPSEVRCNL